MIYNVGVEDIEPNHYVAWAFARPGLTGNGSTAEAAVAHLQVHLSNSEVRVVEEFHSYISSEDPEYLVNAFFEDDKRPLTPAEIQMALDEMLITRQNFLDQVEHLPPEILDQTIRGEYHDNLNGIVKHVALAEWGYCYKMSDNLDSMALLHNPLARTLMDAPPLEALAISRDNTRQLLPSLAGDTRIITYLGEKWSARKVLRRTLWHERDHTQHIAQRLRKMK